MMVLQVSGLSYLTLSRPQLRNAPEIPEHGHIDIGIGIARILWLSG